MEYNQSQGPRPMVDVKDLNLTCDTCKTAITELPFRPATDESGNLKWPVYCREHVPQRKGRRF